MQKTRSQGEVDEFQAIEFAVFQESFVKNYCWWNVKKIGVKIYSWFIYLFLFVFFFILKAYKSLHSLGMQHSIHQLIFARTTSDMD